MSHGFRAWNDIPVYDFGFRCRIEDEIPNSAPNNRFVYF
jgi:hypothetical protein